MLRMLDALRRQVDDLREASRVIPASAGGGAPPDAAPGSGASGPQRVAVIHFDEEVGDEYIAASLRARAAGGEPAAEEGAASSSLLADAVPPADEAALEAARAAADAIMASNAAAGDGAAARSSARLPMPWVLWADAEGSDDGDQADGSQGEAHEVVHAPEGGDEDDDGSGGEGEHEAEEEDEDEEAGDEGGLEAEASGSDSDGGILQVVAPATVIAAPVGGGAGVGRGGLGQDSDVAGGSDTDEW
jgi:hypothetical protein